MKATFLSLLCSLLILSDLSAQTTACPDDPPLNPWLADSPWPTFHRNNYAQASTCLAGPLPGDELLVKTRVDIQGGTSPWVYLTDAYPDGRRALVQSNATHFFKFLDTPEGIVTVDSLRIDFDPLTSFGFAFLQAKDNKWFVPDPKFDPAKNRYSRIIKIEDEDPDDPYSGVVQTGEFSFEDTPVTSVGHLMLNYSGQLVFTGATDEINDVAHVGILDQDLNVLDILEYATFPGEIVSHNSSPVEEDNSWYLVTTHRLIRFDWDGVNITIGWEAFYDFVNDGPTGQWAEGSGTTPTLMGYGDDADQLVVVADGHQQNNLVAFWREIPAGWIGLPGEDIRLAGRIQIPFAAAANNLFQSIENSPAVHGYGIAVAQYNGFLGYDCVNEKGVQKFTWNTINDEWELDWATDDINMNGVLTYSAGSNLIYSSGKEADCNYYLYGLDWTTGALELRYLLGPEGTFANDPFYDAGNNTIIDTDGSLYMPGGASLVKLEISTPVAVRSYEENNRIVLSPNPGRHFLRLEARSGHTIERYRIIDAAGRLVRERPYRTALLSVRDLPPGVYVLQARIDGEWVAKHWVRR